jgi:hypothetical protein
LGMFGPYRFNPSLNSQSLLNSYVELDGFLPDLLPLLHSDIRLYL